MSPFVCRSELQLQSVYIVVVASPGHHHLLLPIVVVKSGGCLVLRGGSCKLLLVLHLVLHLVLGKRPFHLVNLIGIVADLASLGCR